MAEQPSYYKLSPQLGTVLKSLSVNLDAELNRYRRNRHYSSVDSDDLFGDLEAAAFDLDAVESAVEASLASSMATAALSPQPAPPPVPPNRKLSPAEMPAVADPALAPSPQAAFSALPPSPSSATSALIKSPSPQPLLYGEDETGAIAQTISDRNPGPEGETSAALQTNGSAIAPSGYLASSERLIESLSEVPPMPDPVDTLSKPRRKTVSLLAGASLGFVGLVAGLGASYLMANPLVTQRLTSGSRTAETPTTVAPTDTFDPPGPDLSANEFINLEIDNLSSLKMPQSTVTPSISAELTPADGSLQNASQNQPQNQPQNPGVASGLPPIQGAIAPSPSPPTAPIETQAVVVPVGLTYYVTAPYVTPQNLTDIRSSVSEAFVRRFADGNRIQIAAFDNPQAAQAFVEEMQSQDITAQIYGPTTE